MTTEILSSISFRDFIAISEGKQVGILYHFTRLGNLANMLDDNFDMTSNNKYISFTRDYNLIDYHKKGNSLSKNYKNLTSWGEDFIVRLAIDGDKLSNKYKIEPFMDIANGVNHNNSESEERIIGNVLLNDFIVQIDVVYGTLQKENLQNELQKTKLYNNYKFNYVKTIKELRKIK